MLQPLYTPANAVQRAFALTPGALSDRVIAVTGATGGLGTSLCHALAAAGATVILIGRSEKKLDALYDALVNAGASQPAQIPLAQDKAAEAEYAEMAMLIANEFGGLDALIHASTIAVTPMPMGDVKQNDWARSFAVNVSGARLASLAVLPLLNTSPLGSLTFLLDDKAGAYWGAYGISKQAVHALMHMLADETEGQRDADGHPRIAINGYDPGPIRTPLRRKAFPGELEEEAPLPSSRLGPLLGLIARADPSLTGSALHYGSI